MLRATLLGLVAHRLRLALAAIAVVLGVAFVAGTLVLSDTLSATFDDLFGTVTAKVDVQVRGVATIGGDAGRATHPPVPAALVSTVRGVQGVHETFGFLQRNGVILVTPAGKALTTGGAPTLGVLWDPYPDLASLTIRDGRPPVGPDQVVVDAHVADSNHLKVGDRVTVGLPTGAPRTETISGTALFGGRDNLAGATLVAFDPAFGGPLLGARDEFDGISVKGDPGVDAATLATRIASVLPRTAEAVTGQTVAAEQSAAVKSGLSFLTTFLLVFAFIALFTGSFIILNTFSILVTQRQRELALLRALGASRAQVMTSVLIEAALTGLIASAVGVGAGILLAKGLEALLSAIGVDLATASLQIRPRTILVGLVAGTAVTVLASILPARRATRVSPVEAMREAVPPPTAVSVARVGAGLGMTLVGIGVLLVGLFAGVSSPLLFVGIGCLASFVGVAVLAAVIAPPVLAVIGAPLPRLRGVPGALAVENARRNPRRTASTASALMIGVGVVSCFTVVAASFKGSINALVDHTITADYIVLPASFGDVGLPTTAADRVRRAPGVGMVSEISTGRFLHDGVTADVTAVDPPTIDGVAVVTVQAGDQLASLTPSSIAISEDAAKNEHLAVGSVVSAQFERPGLRPLKVVTVFARNPLLGDWLISRAALGAGIAEPLTDQVVAVRGARGVAPAELRSAVLAAVADYPGAKVQDNAEYKKSQADQIDVLLNLMTTLVVLAIVIALLGVVNTLALSIVERTRELGLLRALGMTRRQTRTMVRWETVLITLLGTLLGIVVGTGFGIAFIRALASQGANVLDLAVPRQLVYLVLAVVAGVLAAWFPARRAARVDMLRAIATE